MVKRVPAILLLLAVGFIGFGFGGAGAAAQPSTETSEVDQAYQQMMEARRGADPIEERLKITKEFLDTYPESKYTPRAVAAVVYYYGKLDDMEGAVAYIEAIRAGVADPDIARDLDKEMIVMYGEAGMMDKMLAVAGGLAADEALDFGDYWNIIEFGVKAENWQLVRDYCARAREEATPEAFRGDYPDEDFTDEEVENAGKNRRGMLLVKEGWARANQGEVEQALSDFAEADALVRRSYVGIPEYDLNLYWGKTLMMKGDHGKAASRFAADALVMRHDDALEGLRSAYKAVHGSDQGFEDYASKLHADVAKPMTGFELSDFAGVRHRYDDIKGDVTLVAFWFPT